MVETIVHYNFTSDKLHTHSCGLGLLLRLDARGSAPLVQRQKPDQRAALRQAEMQRRASLDEARGDAGLPHKEQLGAGRRRAGQLRRKRLHPRRLRTDGDAILSELLSDAS